MRKPSAIHGRDHRPGGSDPLTIAGAYAALTRATAQTIVGAGSHWLEWTLFVTTDASVFGTSHSGVSAGTITNASGDDLLVVRRTGMVSVMAGAEWESGTFNRYSLLDGIFDGTGVSPEHGVHRAASAATSTDVTGGSQWCVDWVHCLAEAGQFIAFRQVVATTHDVSRARMGVCWTPLDAAPSVVFGTP